MEIVAFPPKMRFQRFLGTPLLKRFDSCPLPPSSLEKGPSELKRKLIARVLCKHLLKQRK